MKGETFFDSMNYRKIYLKIINIAKRETQLGLRPKTSKEKKNFIEKYEFHHILPKSLFPLWKKRKSNIVTLKLREHFFVHQLLVKIFPSHQMYFALYLMVGDKKHTHNFNSNDYKRLKEKCSKMMSEIMKGREPWNKGRIGVYSEEQLKRMSESRKKATTVETISKIKEARKCQDMSERRGFQFSEESLERMSNSHKGMKWWNNGIEQKQSYICPVGWERGRLPCSEETKKKLRNVNIDKLSDETKELMKKHRTRWKLKGSDEIRTYLQWTKLGYEVNDILFEKC